MFDTTLRDIFLWLRGRLGAAYFVIVLLAVLLGAHYV